MTTTTSSVSRAAITAMRNRAAQLVLTMAWLGKREDFRFAQGLLKSLDDLINTPSAAEFAAQRDASMGGYQPLAGFEAAWAGLPINPERLSMAEVQQLLATQALKLAADCVTDGNFNAVEQFKHGIVAAVDLHDEHDAAPADLNDASVHAASPVVDSSMTQGGAV